MAFRREGLTPLAAVASSQSALATAWGSARVSSAAGAPPLAEPFYAAMPRHGVVRAITIIEMPRIDIGFAFIEQFYSIQ